MPGTLKMTGRGADKDKAMYGEQVIPLIADSLLIANLRVQQVKSHPH